VLHRQDAQDGKTDASGQYKGEAPTLLELELMRVAFQINDAFVTAQQLDATARSFDDFRSIIQDQALLLEAISTRKALARDVDQVKFKNLTRLICNLRLLTTNLDERLKKEESEGAASNIAALRTEDVVLEKQFQELQRKLESMMLPTINIDTALDQDNPHGLDSDEDAENKELDAQEIQEEEDFYKKFYPHLIHYENAQEMYEQESLSRAYDATEMSEMTERSVNDKGVQQAREQLRKSSKGSAITFVNKSKGATAFISKRYKE